MSGNKGRNGGERAHFQKPFHTKHDGPGQLKMNSSILDVLLKFNPSSFSSITSVW